MGTMPKGKVVLRSLIGLIDGMEHEELEGVVEQIEKHRHLRLEAVGLEDGLESKSVNGAERQKMRKAFISAMIALHAQQAVVSTLLEALGYIPEIPGAKPH